MRIRLSTFGMLVSSMLLMSGCGGSAHVGHEGFGADTSDADIDRAKQVEEVEREHVAKVREEAKLAAKRKRAAEGE